MAESVRSSLVHGMAWNFLENILLKGVSFVIGIILARILSPSDYGLIGMLAIFIAISNVFINAGFSKALIQKKACEPQDYSTVFVVNIVVSTVLYAVLFFCAPLIAKFYNEPILILLTRVVSLNLVLGSLNIVQRAQLTSRVDFKSLAKINVTASIVSGVVGVVLAYCGFGVWALVAQTLSSTVVNMVMFPFFSKWKVSFVFSKESFKKLFAFGSKLLATETVSIIVDNISTICIGRFYKKDQLGFYTRAHNFPEIIYHTIYSVLGNVTFPVMSKIQDDRNHLVSLYRRSLYYSALVVFPIMVLCAILAKPMVSVLLTDKWLGCVGMMQWFFLSRIFTPLSALNLNVLNAIGRSDLFLKVDFSKIPVKLIILAITIPIGVEAIVIGFFVTCFVSFFINAYMPGKLFGYGAWAQIKDWRMIFVSVGIMSIVVWLFSYFVVNKYVLLIGGLIIGAVVYLGCCLLFKMIDESIMASIKAKIGIRK